MIALIPVYIALSCRTGYLITRQIPEPLSLSGRLALSFIAGSMLEMLIAHGLAFLTQSFRTASYLSLLILFIINLLELLVYLRNRQRFIPDAKQPNRSKHSATAKEIKNSKESLMSVISLVTALGLGLIYGIRDLKFSNPDRVHNAIYADFANNDIYPPPMPIGLDFSFQNYHFGTDLVGATLKIFSGLAAWESQSIQIAIWVMLFFILCYELLCYCLAGPKQKFLAYLGSLFISFYSSIASYIYLASNLDKINDSGFLVSWIKASWTSISCINTQLRLSAQNLALPIMVALVLVLMLLLNRNAKDPKLDLYSLTFILAFALYFIYPSLYYPLLAGLLIYLFLDLFGNPKLLIHKIQSSSIVIAIFYIAKTLTGTGSASNINGLETLSWAPHLTWTNWGKPYLLSFSNPSHLASLSKSIDPVTGGPMLEIPLFSALSFIDFGDIVLAALILSLVLLFTNRFYIGQKLDSSLLLAFAAFASLPVAFLLVFFPRPIEMTRFILWAKVFALFFVVIVVLRYIQQHCSMTRCYILGSILVLGLIPGFASIYPSKELNFLGSKALSLQRQALIKDLEKLHKSCDVVLDSKIYEIGATLSSLAGYYSIGGQLYKEDQITRATALRLMSPPLLRELRVDYVLIDPKYKLSPQAELRLKDKNIFQEIESISSKYPGYHFYKFLKDSQPKAWPQEHAWVLIYQGPDGKIHPISENNQLIHAKTASELKARTLELKTKNAKALPLVALWMKAQAVPKNLIP